jgi:hypothetical protein
MCVGILGIVVVAVLLLCADIFNGSYRSAEIALHRLGYGPVLQNRRTRNAMKPHGKRSALREQT